MSNNCKCQCNKVLKAEIKRLKGIITGMKKIIMLLKRQVNTIIRLKSAEKTLKGRLKGNNDNIDEIESDEDIIHSDTSSNEDNEKIESTTLKLSLDQ